MVLVNTDYISGKELGMLGMVKGSTIQCKNIGRDIGASFKNLVGGEMKAYTEMMNEARDLAIHRMIGEAEQMGADAVVNVRLPHPQSFREQLKLLHMVPLLSSYTKV